ncbi:MAG: protein kinase [Candidatus Sericytochromatia bacterium]|nr:protein kinase [Candidatus Sericytochromatia bacterium]
MSEFNPFPPEESVELTQLSDLDLGKAEKTATPNRPSFGTAKEKYAKLGTVGAGAMGEILLVRDQELRRKVAYKKVNSGMTQNPKVVDRFFTEAQITAQLEHPNIVPIYSLEISPEGEIGYSMKLIQGKTFKELILEARKQYDQNGKVDEEHSLLTLLEHFLKVCDALHYSHMKGVIHRDLKPANIMVGRFHEVYVMDWGIAKVLNQGEFAPEETWDDEMVGLFQFDPLSPLERTRLGQIIGTPRYMSPQQAAGKNNELDAHCDQFSLGLILFELITLRPAFRAGNQIELLKKVLKVDIEPFQHYFPKQRIPIELQSIVKKATALKTAGRYASVADLADDLRRYLHGEAVLARPDSSLEKLVRWIGKHGQTTLGIVMGVLILASFTVTWSLYRHEQAILKAQAHGKKMTAFFMQVAHRAQLIETQLTEFELLLTYLSSAAQQLYEFGNTRSEPFYTYADFLSPRTSPPDLSYANSYKAKISLDWPIVKLAPGVSQAEVLPILQKLSPLRQTFRTLALQSHSQAAATLAPAAAHSLVMQKGVPLIWAYVGLEQGISINYPGNADFSPDYDARKRPWYTRSLQQKGAHWQTPYLDAGGTGWVLPCTQPIHDSKGHLIGVAGVEMTLEYIKQHLLEIAALPGHLNSYLINEKGQIVSSSRDTKQAGKFSQPEILTQLLKKKSGYLEDSRHKGGRVWAFFPILSLGWIYVVEAETSKLEHEFALPSSNSPQL